MADTHSHAEHHHHDHAYDHAHDHGHAHAHHHHDHGDEYLEQLFTIGICGAFGAVAVALSVPALTNTDPANPSILQIILSPDFHSFVLVAGVVLLAMTLVRVLALWQEAGERKNHVHGPDCNHVHGPDCGHDHDHSHGGVYWRAVVLLFPVVLFIWGQPNQGFSAEWVVGRLGDGDEIGQVKSVTAKEGGRRFSFDELNAFANNADKRESEEGKTATVKGQIRKLGDKEATLYRLKMTCCAADTIPLKARIVTENSLGGITDHAWVEVTGQLQFVHVPGSADYLPLLKTDVKNIKTKGVLPE
ncbi:TIGR03943 family putative permease subunit [Limnoglobus roseus]|uniref:DUF1980 domain-containing protein n=1 Tax=Limnoglobus roseus TaxID=2598579 RepID=A0A5C1AN74_9BACT|nr:hypothetical protein [Limnoglobus roseus]QEL20015.1 hypothetical protein PX52LOC_07099 [Limnoglobus roseus]